MTPDEYRVKCIEAMEAAWFAHYEGRPWRAGAMAAVFDALHGIAPPCPVEATDEMIRAGRKANLAKNPLDGLYEIIWRAMSAAGDLTKPSETKP